MFTPAEQIQMEMWLINAEIGREMTRSGTLRHTYITRGIIDAKDALSIIPRR